MFDFNLMHMILGLPALVLAIVGHEYAHAQVAVLLGDDTPEREGRTSLNPLVHFDPVGTLAMFLVGIGWAKPVQVNPFNFRDPKKDELLVALAGPFANLLMAFLAYVALAILMVLDVELSRNAYQVILLITLYNINFAIFNLLPIPPLDGSRIITAFMSWEARMRMQQYQMISLIVFLVIINTPIWSYIFRPIQATILQAFQTVVNVFIG